MSLQASGSRDQRDAGLGICDTFSVVSHGFSISKETATMCWFPGACSLFISPSGCSGRIIDLFYCDLQKNVLIFNTYSVNDREQFTLITILSAWQL